MVLRATHGSRRTIYKMPRTSWLSTNVKKTFWVEEQPLRALKSSTQSFMCFILTSTARWHACVWGILLPCIFCCCCSGTVLPALPATVWKVGLCSKVFVLEQPNLGIRWRMGPRGNTLLFLLYSWEVWIGLPLECYCFECFFCGNVTNQQMFHLSGRGSDVALLV